MLDRGHHRIGWVLRCAAGTDVAGANELPRNGRGSDE